MGKEIVNTVAAPAAIGPYSQAVQVGGFLFVSGQIALEPSSGTIVSGDVADQTRQVMSNLKAILEAAHCGWESVVRTTIYLRDLSDFADVNGVYGSFFADDPPARSTVQVSGLPLDARVEIDAVAVLERGQD